MGRPKKEQAGKEVREVEQAEEVEQVEEVEEVKSLQPAPVDLPTPLPVELMAIDPKFASIPDDEEPRIQTQAEFLANLPAGAMDPDTNPQAVAFHMKGLDNLLQHPQHPFNQKTMVKMHDQNDPEQAEIYLSEEEKEIMETIKTAEGESFEVPAELAAKVNKWLESHGATGIDAHRFEEAGELCVVSNKAQKARFWLDVKQDT